MPPLQDQGKGFQNEGRQGVAVVLPAGTYRVTKMLEIFQSNVVLRGAGVSARPGLPCLLGLADAGWGGSSRALEPAGRQLSPLCSLAAVPQRRSSAAAHPPACPAAAAGGAHGAALPKRPAGCVWKQNAVGIHGRIPDVRRRAH